MLYQEKQHSPLHRIGFDILLALSVFWAPWWIVLTLASVGFLLFTQFIEGVAAGFLIDLLYGLKGVLGFEYLVTTGGVIVFFVISVFKQYIRR